MSKITPFKAIRPVRDKVHLVATRPIYSYKRNVLESKLEDNPYTFLHIINPEFGGERMTQPNTIERFELVKKEYEKYIKDGILRQDEEAHIYIYRQTKNGHSFTGIVCGADNEEYRQDLIKKHEATLTSREEMFVDYLDIVGYNAEPVLMAYPHNQSIEDTLKEYTLARPEYEFTTTDRITHELWVLDQGQTAEIIRLFDAIPALYIADGHHRSASSVGLENRRVEENRSHFPNEKAFLAFIMDENALQILEFNRVIKSINGKTEEQILTEIEPHFEIIALGQSQLPQMEHEITMCLKGNWYSLACKEETIEHNHPVNRLDAEILTRYILGPVLDIKDLKTSDNIEFIGGTTPISKIEEKIEKGTHELAFFLYPVKMEDVVRVADNQMIMPPKSTWVEPKLRSGLTIYNINE